MNDTDALSPGIGHNQPPYPQIARTTELLEAVNRATHELKKITDAETAGRCQEFIEQLLAQRDAIDAEWKKEREPHEQEIVLLRVRYRDPIELLELSIARMRGLVTPWTQAEQDRLNREAEDRRLEAIAARQRAERVADQALQSGTVEAELAAIRAIEEAEEAERAAGKQPGRAKVKGDLGKRAMSLKTYWSASVVNETLALRHFAKNADVREAALVEVKRICNRLARELKDESAAPPGVQFIKREVAQ